jgi:hypothetical protein
MKELLMDLMQLMRKKEGDKGDSEKMFVSGSMWLVFTDMKITVPEQHCVGEDTSE